MSLNQKLFILDANNKIDVKSNCRIAFTYLYLIVLNNNIVIIYNNITICLD